MEYASLRVAGQALRQQYGKILYLEKYRENEFLVSTVFDYSISYVNWQGGALYVAGDGAARIWVRFGEKRPWMSQRRRERAHLRT